jgi:hypothetical protein
LFVGTLLPQIAAGPDSDETATITPPKSHYVGYSASAKEGARVQGDFAQAAEAAVEDVGQSYSDSCWTQGNDKRKNLSLKHGISAPAGRHLQYGRPLLIDCYIAYAALIIVPAKTVRCA